MPRPPMIARHFRYERGRAIAPSRWWTASIVVVALLALASAGCDPGHDVTYQNETNEFIDIFSNGRFSLSLEPMQTRKLDKIMFFGRVTFEARDAAGRVLYRESFTWEELKEACWRIVITDEATIPTP